MQKPSIIIPNNLMLEVAMVAMTRGVEVKEGQSFQDRTGLTVKVERIDANNRIHFSVIDYREGTSAGPGEMSDFSFVNRFTRIDKRSHRKAA